MKKTLLALGAACFALSSMAATPKHSFKPSPLIHDRNIMVRSQENHNVGFAPTKMKKVAAKIGSPEDIITSAEGTRQNMTVTGSGYFVSYYYYVIGYENESAAGHVVYGENDEVYLCNIIPYGATDTYIKGTKNGDKIEVSLPQTVMWFDDVDYGYNFCLLEIDPEESSEEEGNWYKINDATSVSFTVAEDGSITADGLSDELILGYAYTDDDSWGGYGVSELSMTPFNDKAVEVPNDIEISKHFWSYYCEELGYGWPISWGQGYDEVYFQGFGTEMPDACIKGTVEYDDSEAIISLASNQYVGDRYGFHVYTKSVKLLYDEDYDEEYYELLPDDYQYQLVWDFEENTISPKDPDIVFLLNLGKDKVNYLEQFYDFTLAHQESFAGVPQNPENLVFVDFMEDYDEYDLYFNLSGFSTEGNVLLTDNLSYVVYVDDEEWTFDASDYYLSEDMVEIPWSFDSDYIFKYYGTMHQIAFFVEGISTIGVQSIYKYDGEETRSDIVTINVDGSQPNAVGAVNTGKKVVDVKYYDLAGRQVANPATGVFVKRVTFEDGGVATFKKAIR